MGKLAQAVGAAAPGARLFAQRPPSSPDTPAPDTHLRLLIVGCLALTWLLLVILRLVDLQIVQSSSLAAKAARQHDVTVEIPARRGGLLDRRGRELALSTPVQSIGIYADRVADPSATATLLAANLAVDGGALRRRIERGGFQWVKRMVSLAEAERARTLDLEVLHFETESKRYYPHGTVAAHVLGTVSLDHLGQAGLEQRFEAQLRGKPGLGVLHYDARHKRYGRQEIRASVPGNDLLLNLDLDLQSLVHMELERAVQETESQAGTVVLMRPYSGEVVAVASWPRFDPNNLSRTAEDLENHRNFAVSYLVEPGSTFKVLTAAAALNEGLVGTEDVFDCEMGGMWIDRRRIRDHHPFGMLTMPQVLMKSSNVGIIKIGHRLGEEKLHDYIRRFGFGRRTGIALPGESHGLVRPLERWSSASLASLSMGQEIGVTAIQMASLFGAVANGGQTVKPRIVRAIREQGGAEVELESTVSERVISPNTAATMQAILEQVVADGTGRLAQIPGYRVAGKTGTAQMINPTSRSYQNGVYLASFCGFAPVNDPALVGVVMLYDPRGEFYYGGRIAAPLFSAVMRRALRLLDVPPSQATPHRTKPAPAVSESVLADFVEGRAGDPEREAFLADSEETPQPEHAAKELEHRVQVPEAERVLAKVSASAPAPDEAKVAPDMRGLTMREAYSLAARVGIELYPRGSGLARLQSPRPNEILTDGEPLEVYFGISEVGHRESAGGG